MTAKILTGVHWSNSGLLIKSIQDEFVLICCIFWKGVSFLSILLEFLLHNINSITIIEIDVQSWIPFCYFYMHKQINLSACNSKRWWLQRRDLIKKNQFKKKHTHTQTKERDTPKCDYTAITLLKYISIIVVPSC